MLCHMLIYLCFFSIVIMVSEPIFAGMKLCIVNVREGLYRIYHILKQICIIIKYCTHLFFHIFKLQNW